MTECYMQHENEKAPCICDNCGHECTADQLEMIRDIQERITPGDIVPAGECPDCGGLSYLKNPPDYSAQGKLESLGKKATPL